MANINYKTYRSGDMENYFKDRYPLKNRVLSNIKAVVKQNLCKKTIFEQKLSFVLQPLESPIQRPNKRLNSSKLTTKKPLIILFILLNFK